MQQFLINWNIPGSDLKSDGISRHIPQLKLNDDWTILFSYPQSSSERHYTRIRRKITFEKVLVSGKLSYQINGNSISIQEFSKLIEPGSSFITIHLRDPRSSDLPYTYSLAFGVIICTLSGVVYISSTSEKCADELAKEDYKKNGHLKSLVQLSNDFERLLNPQTSCLPDVNLKCGDVSIPAHKNILSARSPVFAALFANEMKQNHENQLIITDMDASVVWAMVTYIYTGKTSNLTVSSATDLLFAADKCQLEDLKRVFCDSLKENVSIHNVLRILDMGDKYSEDLKTFALDYICNKRTDFSVVERSEDWKTFKKERADLAMHVLTSLLKSRDGKGFHAS